MKLLRCDDTVVMVVHNAAVCDTYTSDDSSVPFTAEGGEETFDLAAHLLEFVAHL